MKKRLLVQLMLIGMCGIGLWGCAGQNRRAYDYQQARRAKPLILPEGVKIQNRENLYVVPKVAAGQSDANLVIPELAPPR